MPPDHLSDQAPERPRPTVHDRTIPRRARFKTCEWRDFGVRTLVKAFAAVCVVCVILRVRPGALEEAAAVITAVGVLITACRSPRPLGLRLPRR